MKLLKDMRKWSKMANPQWSEESSRENMHKMDKMLLSGSTGKLSKNMKDLKSVKLNKAEIWLIYRSKN